MFKLKLVWHPSPILPDRIIEVPPQKKVGDLLEDILHGLPKPRNKGRLQVSALQSCLTSHVGTSSLTQWTEVDFETNPTALVRSVIFESSCLRLRFAEGGTLDSSDDDIVVVADEEKAKVAAQVRVSSDDSVAVDEEQTKKAAQVKGIATATSSEADQTSDDNSVVVDEEQTKKAAQVKGIATATSSEAGQRCDDNSVVVDEEQTKAAAREREARIPVDLALSSSGEDNDEEQDFQDLHPQKKARTLQTRPTAEDE